MSRSKLSKYILILCVSFLLVACGAAPTAFPESAMPPMESDGGFAGEEPSRDFADVSYDTTANSIPSQDVERVIIRTANLTIVVNDPPASMDVIKKMAEEMGGFVVSSNLSQTTLENGRKVPSGTIAIRVPAEQLDQALAQIRQESDQLPLVEDVNSQDVTKEYVDLESRLKNLEATERQLNKFLEETTKTEETLQVYNELVRVREQIEVIKGQLNYYAESAAFSLITAQLMANEAIQPLSIGGWQPVGVIRDSIQGLINFFQWLIDFLLRLLILILPALLVLFVIFVLPILLIVRYFRRRSKKNKQAAAVVQPEANPTGGPMEPPASKE